MEGVVFKETAPSFWCAAHGESLDGASPLWGNVVTNH